MAMTLEELERGLEIHQRQIQELRDNQRVQGELLDRTDKTIANMAGLMKHHQQQVGELRDNQRVQGELLSRTDRTIADTVGLVKQLAEQMVLLQSGVDALVKSMDTLRKSLEGGDGRRPKE